MARRSPLMVSAFLLGGMVAAAYRQRRRVHSSCLYHLIAPRLVLLQALVEACHKLPSVIGEGQWGAFSKRFVQVLGTIEEEVVKECKALQNWLTKWEDQRRKAAVDREEQGIDVLMKEVRNGDKLTIAFSQAIDKHLVRWLQGSERVAAVVEGYLPPPQQSWLGFLNSTLLNEEERQMAGLLPQSSTLSQQVQDLAAGFLLLRELQCRCRAIKVSVPERSGGIKITHMPPPAHYIEETVYYATDRQVTEDCEYRGVRRRSAATSSPLEGLHYGYVIVGIPAGVHVPGRIEGPASRDEESTPLSHVVILSVDATMQSSPTLFVEKLNSDLARQEVQGGSNDILLYIHGYNVAFKDAMKRAAQLKYDLNLSGAIISYSWSSQGRIYGYKHDETAVEETVSCLAPFIKLCITQVQARKVHILAHSMGNRALIKALKKLYSEKADVQPTIGGVRWSLKNVILAAADERRSRFEEMVKLAKENYSKLCAQKQHADLIKPHFSVYCSREDLALIVSRVIHAAGETRARLGDTRSHLEKDAGTLAEEYVDVIDATGIDINQLHHSYYGDVPTVLQDIKQLIASSGDANSQSRGESPAAARAHHEYSEGAIKKVTHDRKQFYAFSPRHWPSHR